MKLVEPLVAGIAGCESGHAEIYTRGSASRSGYYTNAEGTGSPATTDVALDANGRAVVYVDEYADVQVYDSDGVLSIEFTVMDTDRTTEVISQSFTGQAYAGGGSAASLPVSLNAVLDAWLTNAGAVDWKVDVLGTATAIGDAIERGYGALFSVKAYGAVGDGATNDRSAILAAQTAADAAGGIVFFPEGTYNCDSAVTWNDTNILGIPGKAVISGSSWAFRSTDGDKFRVHGLSFSSTNVTAADAGGAADITFSLCEFSSVAGSYAFRVTGSGSGIDVLCLNCKWTISGTSSGTLAIDTDSHTSGMTTIVGGEIVVASGFVASGDLIHGHLFRIRGLHVDLSGGTVNNLSLIMLAGTGSALVDVEVDGLVATATGGGGAPDVINFSFAADGSRVILRNLSIGFASPDLFNTSFSALADVADRTVVTDFRKGRVYYESGTIDGTDSLAEQKSYECIWYNKTDTGALTIDLDANPPPPGSRTVIVVVNASGGSPTLDVSGVDVGNNSSHGMTAGRKTIYYVDHFATDGVVVNAVQNIA